MTTADRIGYLLVAAAAGATASLVRTYAGPYVLNGPWLLALLLGLGAVALALALRPTQWAHAEIAGLALLAGLRLAIPLALSLGWTAGGREVWVAVAMLGAVQGAGKRARPRWPLVPAAIASALVIAWSATEPRVAPARAVLIVLACACAAVQVSGRRADP